MEQIKELEVGITLAEVKNEEDPENSLVEVLIKIPYFFGERQRTMMLVPRSLFMVPGVSEIIQKTIPKVIEAFVQSTGGRVKETVVKNPEKFTIQPLCDQKAN